MTRAFFARSASSRYPLTAVGVVMALLVATAAQAGFEIRGAGIPQTPPVSGGAIESDSSLAPIGMMPDAAGRPTIPVTAVPIDAPAPIDMAPAQAAAGEAGTIDGFGYDLPLVIALQQVAPAGYQFSFSPSIDPGTRVSWQGGRAWRDVVRDMLAPLGLAYEVRDGNVLAIAPKNEMTTPLQTAQVTPAAAPLASSGETQQMRRQKPSSLLDRMKSSIGRDDEYHVAPSAPAAPAAVAAAPIAAPTMLAPEERVIEPMRAPVPAADSLSMAQDDLSPIELTAGPMSTTAAIARPPAPSEAVVGQDWQARQGDTLRDVMSRWSGRAGIDMRWSIDYDYRLPRDVQFSGGYADAVTSLLDMFKKAKPRPYAQLHRQPGATQVLVVKAYGVNE